MSILLGKRRELCKELWKLNGYNGCKSIIERNFDSRRDEPTSLIGQIIHLVVYVTYYA